MSYSPEIDENFTDEVIGAEHDGTSVINQEIGINSEDNLQVDDSTIFIGQFLCKYSQRRASNI